MAGAFQRGDQPVSAWLAWPVRLLGWAVRLLAGLTLLGLVAVLGAWALAHNEAATAALLGRLPGVMVVGPSGALLGDFQAQRVDVALPRGGTLRLLAPAWQGLALHADPEVAWHLGVSAKRLSVQRLDLVWVSDPAAPPSTVPNDVSLPVSVWVGQVAVDEAHSALWGAAPLLGVRASDLALNRPSSEARPSHRLALQSLAWSDWQVQGQAQLGTTGRLPLALALRLSQVAKAGQGAAQAQLALKGPLADLLLDGQAQWQAGAQAASQREQGPETAPQSVKLSGRLQPFAAWPVPSLSAQAQTLDLAALWPGLPRTRLSGTLTLSPAAQDDLLAKVALRNALPGAWDAERLPLRALSGGVRWPHALKAADWAQVLLSGQVDLQAELPSVGTLPPGQLSLAGQWQEAKAKAQAAAPTPGERQAQLTLALQGVTLQALDGRAPPLRLQGTAHLMPSQAPNQAWQSGLALDMQGTSSPAFAAALAVPGAAKQAKVWQGLPSRAVSLQAQGQLSASQLSLRSLSLASQGQRASLSDAVLKWSADASAPPWSARGAVQVQAFDPALWLPWPVAMKGHNELVGEATFDVNAQWQGQLKAKLLPSTLGGLPVQGQVQWQSLPQQAQGTASLDLDLAGNQASAQGQWPKAAQASKGTKPGQGAAWSPQLAGQQWQVRVQAPALQKLQALVPLLGLSQISGEVNAQARLNGAWPAFDTQGQIAVNTLQWRALDAHPAPAGALATAVANKPTTGKAPRQAVAPGMPLMSLDELSGQWQLDLRSLNAPVQGQLQLKGLKLGAATLGQAKVQLEGTGRAHQMVISADASVANAPARPVPLRLDVKAQGGLPTGGPLGWQGRVQDLWLRTVAASPQTLLQAQAFDLAWRTEPLAHQLSLSPTRLVVMGADLNLQRLNWRWPLDMSDGQGEADVQLQLAPLNVPALLTRWQPQAGWGGDLLLTGALSLQHAAHRPWVLDAALQRQSGDLTLSEPTIEGNSQQRLGIRDARVSLQARDGVWTLTEQLEGRGLGQLTGRQVVRAAAPELLPTASDALSGDVDLQIGNLRPWGVWAPAGWRLSGQLQAKASVGGTLGAPQYRGQVKGQNLGMGQALLGVNVTDGELQLDLQGAQAQLTRFVAKGGSQGGTLKAEGEAQLGEAPQARVRIEADHFALLQRIDRRIVISGQAQATLGEQDARVDGRLRVDEGLIDISRSDAPTVGDDVNVLNRPGQVPDAEPDAVAAPPTQRKVTAAVEVDLGKQLRLRGRGLDTLLTGALRVTTPNNRPTLTGAVNTSQGTFAAYGQKLVIERGSITFTGPIENPRLDILAMRAQSAMASSVVSSSEVKVGVSITGTALDPRVSLYSDPTLSETEKLSWLVLGRAPTGLGGADLGLLQTAAVALLSGDKPSPTDNLIGLLGLDELSVRQTDGTVRDTVVNVGKQVSKYWYVGYERNLNATGGSWQLIYRLAQRLTLRVQTGEDNAIDLIRSWRWD